MDGEFKKLLVERDNLVEWWHQYEDAKKRDSSTKLGVQLDCSAIRVLFSSDVSKIHCDSFPLMLNLAGIVCDNADAIVEKAVVRTLGELNTELNKMKQELQKLLDSV